MEHAGLLQRGKFDPAWPASLVFHLVVGVFLLAFLPKVEPVRPPPEDSIDVQVVSVPAMAAPSPLPAVQAPRDDHEVKAGAAAQEAASAAPETAAREAPPSPPALPGPVTSGPPLTSGPPQLVQAKELFSKRALASPRSRKAREMLGSLSGGERNLQLCNLEALEQINRLRPGSAPDLVAPYAMKAEKVRGNSVEVDGGAFRSKRNWFNIRFNCEVDPTGQAVVAFAFAIGDAIPKDEWQEHNLVADDGEADQ